MADRMSFDKYIDNPSGRASVITNRNMYKEMYKKKFDAVLLREQGKIVYEVYKSDDKTDSYYIYMKIPSEVIKKFYYDVVVRLYTTSNSKKASTSLREYAVEFYSNDPAFVYTFAHSFAKNKLFIDDLSSKMSKKALSTRAVVKNPKDEVWYIKSLYFAYLTMEKYNLFNRTILDNVSKKYSKNDLLKKITHADVKVEDRKKEQDKLNKSIKKEKQKPKQEKRNINISSPQSKISSTTKVIKNTKTTKKTSNTKTSRIISASKNHNK